MTKSLPLEENLNAEETEEMLSKIPKKKRFRMDKEGYIKSDWHLPKTPEESKLNGIIEARETKGIKSAPGLRSLSKLLKRIKDKKGVTFKMSDKAREVVEQIQGQKEEMEEPVEKIEIEAPALPETSSHELYEPKVNSASWKVKEEKQEELEQDRERER